VRQLVGARHAVPAPALVSIAIQNRAHHPLKYLRAWKRNEPPRQNRSHKSPRALQLGMLIFKLLSKKNERPVGGPAARAWGMEGLAT
jgi:hypothetical protein